MKEIKSTINNSTNESIKEVFKTSNIILSQRQPNNLLKIFSSAKFSEKPTTRPKILPCNNSRCNLCPNYIQYETEFQLSNGKVWTIKDNMSCNSKNVIYFLTCNQCNGNTTYIGKTNNIRLRTNQHISTCRTGKGTDKFDLHVFHCKDKPPKEPFFKLYLLMHLTTNDALLTYEKHFHDNSYDTLNAPNS